MVLCRNSKEGKKGRGRVEEREGLGSLVTNTTTFTKNSGTEYDEISRRTCRVVSC